MRCGKGRRAAGSGATKDIATQSKLHVVEQMIQYTTEMRVPLFLFSLNLADSDVSSQNGSPLPSQKEGCRGFRFPAGANTARRTQSE